MIPQIRGIVRDTRTIEVETALPYEDGSDLVLHIETVPVNAERPPEDMVRRLRAVVGIGRSGLADVSENKHRYLAEAYGSNNQRIDR